MRKSVVVICLILGLIVFAQDYRRKIPRQSPKPAVPTSVIALADTLEFPGDSMRVAGFEKPLKAVKETMFVSNGMSRSVSGLTLEITYSDSKGRMLHKATHDVSVDLPAGETRRIEVPSFDRQGLFYYKLSPLPPKAKYATPFDVKIKIIKAIIPQ